MQCVSRIYTAPVAFQKRHLYGPGCTEWVEHVFRIDASSIDKSLPVPVGTQLHGLLNYALAFGGIPYGTKLQSVRQLAAELNIAPMTVSQVYQRLRNEGLIEMRQGLGAFATSDPGKRTGEHMPVCIAGPVQSR